MQEVIILDCDEIQSAQDMLEAFDNNYGIFLGDDDVAFFDIDSICQASRNAEHAEAWQEARLNQLSAYAHEAEKLREKRFANSLNK